MKQANYQNPFLNYQPNIDTFLNGQLTFRGSSDSNQFQRSNSEDDNSEIQRAIFRAQRRLHQNKPQKMTLQFPEVKQTLDYKTVEDYIVKDGVYQQVLLEMTLPSQAIYHHNKDRIGNTKCILKAIGKDNNNTNNNNQSQDLLQEYLQGKSVNNSIQQTTSSQHHAVTSARNTATTNFSSFSRQKTKLDTSRSSDRQIVKKEDPQSLNISQVSAKKTISKDKIQHKQNQLSKYPSKLKNNTHQYQNNNSKSLQVADQLEDQSSSEHKVPLEISGRIHRKSLNKSSGNLSVSQKNHKLKDVEINSPMNSRNNNKNNTIRIKENNQDKNIPEIRLNNTVILASSSVDKNITRNKNNNNQQIIQSNLPLKNEVIKEKNSKQKGNTQNQDIINNHKSKKIRKNSTIESLDSSEDEMSVRTVLQGYDYSPVLKPAIIKGKAFYSPFHRQLETTKVNSSLQMEKQRKLTLNNNNTTTNAATPLVIDKSRHSSRSQIQVNRESEYFSFNNIEFPRKRSVSQGKSLIDNYEIKRDIVKKKETQKNQNSVNISVQDLNMKQELELDVKKMSSMQLIGYFKLIAGKNRFQNNQKR